MSTGLPSPCISVCRMHAASGWCEGCRRTLDEIARWSTMSEAEKQLAEAKNNKEAYDQAVRNFRAGIVSDRCAAL